MPKTALQSYMLLPWLTADRPMGDIRSIVVHTATLAAELGYIIGVPDAHKVKYAASLTCRQRV